MSLSIYFLKGCGFLNIYMYVLLKQIDCKSTNIHMTVVSGAECEWCWSHGFVCQIKNVNESGHVPEHFICLLQAFLD